MSDDDQTTNPPVPPRPKCAICRGDHATVDHPKGDDEPGGG